MGARLRADVTDNLTLVGALFDGNAAGPGPDDPQLRDRYGVNFRVNDPPLFLSEAQFQWNSKKGDPGLDGKLKLGGWRHLGSFDDDRLDANGLSLANPATSGTPASHAGDYGLYAVFEQKLFRVNNDDDRGIGVFARASYSPPDRNLIDVYADGGVEFIGLADARPHDKFGLAVAYAHCVALGAGAGSRFPVLLRAMRGRCERRRAYSPPSTSTRCGAASRCNPMSSTSAIPAVARPIRPGPCRACR